MYDSPYPYQQAAPQQPPVVESASATTNHAANTSGGGVYVAFLVATVLLCVLLTHAGAYFGQVLGEHSGEFIAEYGDEMMSVEDYEELQGLLGDDPVSPDFGDLLDGATENA